MKRLVGMVLCIFLLLGFSPALAAETDEAGASPRPTFSDVPENAWYAESVEICVQAGLMKGTGSGAFRPLGTVSQAECLALATRLHSLEHSGTSALPKAPGTWGRAILTEADGRTSDLYASSYSALIRTGFSGSDVFALQITDTPADLARLFPAGDEARPVTLSLEGQILPGILALQGKGSSPYAIFVPDSGETDAVSILFSEWCQIPSPRLWYRDYVYYASEHDLITQSNIREWPATRLDLMKFLLPATKELLTPINTVTALPDVDAAYGETVFPFYRAGILAGSDRYGTFRGGQTLTRGELAAVAARLARPELRLHLALTEPAYVDYTLTALTEPGWLPTASHDFYQSFYYTRQDDGYGQNADLLAVINWRSEGQPQTGVLGLDGRWVASPRYTDIGVFSSTGIAVVQKDFSGYGVIDRTGTEIVPPIYQLISEVNGDTLLAMREGRWYALDSSGHVLGRFSRCVEPHESPFYGPSEGLVAYCEGVAYTPSHIYGFLDLEGNVAISAAYPHVRPFSEGLATVVTGDGLGYIDKTGQIVIPARYAYPGGDSDTRFHNGVAFVGDPNTGRTGAIDRAGNTVIPFLYDFLGVRADGMCYFERDNLRGYLTEANTELITDYGAYPYSNGYAVTRSETSTCYGYMDKRGVPVVPLEFDYCGPMTAQGTAFVAKGDVVYRLTLDRG